MATIEAVGAREILDSRGNPTVEVEVAPRRRHHRPAPRSRPAPPPARSRRSSCATATRAATAARACRRPSAPCSTQIGPELVGFEASEQRLVDQAMLDLDGTDNKASLGANAILGVSLAVAKAAADSADLPLFRYLGGPNAHVLPVPMMNILNGGAHADTDVDIQEFMIAPIGADDVPRGAALGRRDLPRAQVRAEGARAWPPASATRAASRPSLPSNRDGARPDRRGGREGRLHPRHRHRARARRRGDRVLHATAATASRAQHAPPSEMTAYYARAGRRTTRSSPSRTRWPRTTGTGWTHLTAALGDQVQIVGDDLFVTNPERLQRGHRRRARANALLVKVNQIGTLTETLDAVDLAHRNGYRCMMSHRSGETEDTTIADLAVATDCGQIKTGAPARVRARRQVQPAAAHRGGAGRRGAATPGAGAFPRFGAADRPPRGVPERAAARRGRRRCASGRPQRARGAPGARQAARRRAAGAAAGAPGTRAGDPRRGAHAGAQAAARSPRRPAAARRGRRAAARPAHPRRRAGRCRSCDRAASSSCCWRCSLAPYARPWLAAARAARPGPGRAPASCRPAGRRAAGRSATAGTTRRTSRPRRGERLHGHARRVGVRRARPERRPAAAGDGPRTPRPAVPPRHAGSGTARCGSRRRAAGARPERHRRAVTAPPDRDRAPTEPTSRPVAAQLGRAAARRASASPTGAPAACPTSCETAPRLPDGTPFPTTYYLTCPRATGAVGTLEAGGLMREMTERLRRRPGARGGLPRGPRGLPAPRGRRSATSPRSPGSRAGGMPDRVKCLHVLVAHALAAGPGVNPLGDEALAALPPWWAAGPCVPGRRGPTQVRRTARTGDDA